MEELASSVTVASESRNYGKLIRPDRVTIILLHHDTAQCLIDSCLCNTSAVRYQFSHLWTEGLQFDVLGKLLMRQLDYEFFFIFG